MNTWLVSQLWLRALLLNHCLDLDEKYLWCSGCAQSFILYFDHLHVSSWSSRVRAVHPRCGDRLSGLLSTTFWDGLGLRGPANHVWGPPHLLLDWLSSCGHFWEKHCSWRTCVLLLWALVQLLGGKRVQVCIHQSFNRQCWLGLFITKQKFTLFSG